MKRRDIDFLETALQVITILALTTLAFIFLSCTSTKKDKYYLDLEKLKSLNHEQIKIGTICVLYENSDNQILKNQITEIVKLKNFQLLNHDLFLQNPSLTKKIEEQNEEKIFLNITIQEQSFLSNFENYNSILTIATLTDSDNNIIYQNNFYSKTKDTICSSICQNKEIEKVFQNLKKIKELLKNEII